MFGERGFRSLISLWKSLWSKTSSDRRPDHKKELTTIPIYVPQAYPNGYPWSNGRAASDHQPELDTSENDRS